MKDLYLQPSKMLNYGDRAIQDLIEDRKWRDLNEYDRIGAIYGFVRNEILLGYNESDRLTATEVLKDGIGQCNTKTTLLISLLRATGIPARLHGAKVTKEFQKSLMPKIMAGLAPSRFVHTWAEVFYCDEWIALEGVITDQQYIDGLKRRYPQQAEKFFDYAVAVGNFGSMQLDWSGKSTFVQSLAVVEDFGIFATPDEFFTDHAQEYRGMKKFLYEKVGRKIMTKRAAKIRREKR